MQQPTLYLFVGYPGAGKTTIAHIIAEATGAVHLWADKERHDRFGGIYRQEQSEELYNQLNAETTVLLKQGESVIFDTNFNYYRDREYLRQVAQAANANVTLIWLTTPKELSYQRAIADTEGRRMFITMTHEDFERVASHLEPPRDDEHPVKIDGTHVEAEAVKQQLGI